MSPPASPMASNTLHIFVAFIGCLPLVPCSLDSSSGVAIPREASCRGETSIAYSFFRSRCHVIVQAGRRLPASSNIAPRLAASSPEGGWRKAVERLEGIAEMSVAGKAEVEGQLRDVVTTRKIDQRAVEPQPHAVATQRHAFRPREGVGEVSA